MIQYLTELIFLHLSEWQWRQFSVEWGGTWSDLSGGCSWDYRHSCVDSKEGTSSPKHQVVFPSVYYPYIPQESNQLVCIVLHLFTDLLIVKRSLIRQQSNQRGRHNNPQNPFYPMNNSSSSSNTPFQFQFSKHSMNSI